METKRLCHPPKNTRDMGGTFWLADSLVSVESFATVECHAAPLAYEVRWVEPDRQTGFDCMDRIQKQYDLVGGSKSGSIRVGWHYS